MNVLCKTMFVFILLFESCEAMDKSSDLTVKIDPQAGAAWVETLGSVKQIEIPVEKTPSGQFVVLVPIRAMFSLLTGDSYLEARVLSLLEACRTERFGVNPDITFVLSENSIESFNTLFVKLGAALFDILPFCSDDQVERIVKQLELSSGTAAQSAYSACSEFSEKSESEISQIESYFNNVSERMEMLVEMIRK